MNTIARKNNMTITTKPPKIPIVQDLDAKVYAAASAPGALEMLDWHTCDKTHCRAGWIVTLAGEAGRKLEAFHSTAYAATRIYHASTGRTINVARFFDENEDALADMKRCAELYGESSK